MLNSSIMALAIGLLLIFGYVAVRFEISFAIGAIVALAHDIIITVGIVVLCGYEVSLILIGAILTIAGYSINDTIVVFDRIREGLKSKRGNVIDVMNLCLNETIGRTLLTSITTLIVVVSLFFFGGPALNSFAFTIIIGVLIGTYSSIFIAAPIVLWWARTRKLNLRREVLDAEQAAVKPIGGQG
jgi:SecD/SecF fusion protein